MDSTSVILPADDPVIVIERVFDAPRALMFKLFTDPFHLVHFWGPHGTTNPVCEMDVRPGGRWLQVMRFPNGNEYRSTSVYLEIVEPERIVYRDVPEDSSGLDGLPAPQLVTTILFEDLGGRTKLVAHVRAQSVAHRDETVRRGFAEVVSQGYERIDVYLTTLEHYRSEGEAS
jgi:uncharacterized protein YndB with AHSA1/START domain